MPVGSVGTFSEYYTQLYSSSMIIKHCLHVWSYIQNVVLHSKCTIPPSPAVSAEPLGLSLSEGEVHVHVVTMSQSDAFKVLV